MNLRAVSFCLALAGCGGSQCECDNSVEAVVTVTVHDGSGQLVANPTFTEGGVSISAKCTDASAATCPSWTFLLYPGENDVDITDGNGGVATSVGIDVEPRACVCDRPAPVSTRVTLMSSS